MLAGVASVAACLGLAVISLVQLRVERRKRSVKVDSYREIVLLSCFMSSGRGICIRIIAACSNTCCLLL